MQQYGLLMPTSKNDESQHSVLSDHEEKLAIFSVTEAAKSNIVKWLRGAIAPLSIIMTLFGGKAYTDYQSALSSIDKKVEERVQSEVAEYRKFTDQIVSAVVEAKTRANEFGQGFNLRDRQRKNPLDPCLVRKRSGNSLILGPMISDVPGL